MGARPLTLRCPKCKVYEEWDYVARERRGLAFTRPSGENLRATGRSKTLRNYHRCHNVTLYEIQHDGCDDHDRFCGRIFWSNHSGARRLFEQAGAHP